MTDESNASDVQLQYAFEELAKLRKDQDRARRLHSTLGVLAILTNLGTGIAALATESQALTGSLALVAGALLGISAFFQFKETWVRTAAAATELEDEIMDFKAKVSPYDDASKALTAFRKRVRDIRARELRAWKTAKETQSLDNLTKHASPAAQVVRSAPAAPPGATGKPAGKAPARPPEGPPAEPPRTKSG